MIPQSNFYPMPIYGHGQVSPLGALSTEDMVTTGTNVAIGGLSGYLVGRLLGVPWEGAAITAAAGLLGLPMLGLVATALYSGTK